MANSQSAHPPQMFGQSPFFYYNPETNTEHRQHGLFTAQPSTMVDRPQMQQFHQSGYSQESLVQGQQMMYSRPASSGAHCFLPSQTATHLASTQLASPRPLHQKPAFLFQPEGQRLSLNTDCHTPDVFVYPSTPPLSVSGSTVSSPPSTCGVLPTPVIGSHFALENIEGVKEGCEGDVQSEILAGGDWTRCCSPPLTPVFIHPPSVTGSQASELLSINSCPSLSPSPSPAPHILEPCTDFDYCDPRNLLALPHPDVSALSPDFSILPALCSEDDEDRQHFTTTDSNHIKLEPHFTHSYANFGTNTLGGLPAFESFSDLDSENDFVTDLSRFTPPNPTVFPGSKRQRFDLAPFDEEEFLSESSFEDYSDVDQFVSANLVTPPDSRRTSEDESVKMNFKKRTLPKKLQKTSPSTEPAKVESAIEQSLNQSAATSSSDQHSTGPQQASSTSESHAGSSDSNAAQSSTDATSTGSQPIARRGRKQSLTEDPSKTFVCTLCSRRFRRQEHLKRHYRSLHTHDKPFECNDCGKTFSRSDNLSQHARTHGTGAIVMGVLEDGELPLSEKAESIDGDTGALGAVLFEAAQAAAANSSSTSSSSGNSVRDSLSPAPSPESMSIRKRKREE